MEKTTIGFPVPNRMQDINELVRDLKKANLIGNWRFVHGSRYDQEWIEVEFDHPEDGETAEFRCGGGRGSATHYPR